MVRQGRQAGIPIVPIPGPCAAVTALSVAGLPSDRFVFEGFLPVKANARYARLHQLADENRTLIFYEAPRRLLESMQAMVEIFGPEREGVIARELTKFYEAVHTGGLATLLTWVEQSPESDRGELVLLIHGADKKQDFIKQEALKVLAPLLKILPFKTSSSCSS